MATDMPLTQGERRIREGLNEQSQILRKAGIRPVRVPWVREEDLDPETFEEWKREALARVTPEPMPSGDYPYLEYEPLKFDGEEA